MACAVVIVLFSILSGSCISEKHITGFDNGNSVPEISLPDSSGKQIKLSGLQGHVVLIAIWDASNTQCRKDRKELSRIYSEYQDRHFRSGDGFAIYSISFDDNTATWKNALRQDKTSWPDETIETNGYNSSLSIKYGISSLPRYILVDESGKVINRNLLVSDLEGILKDSR